MYFALMIILRDNETLYLKQLLNPFVLMFFPFLGGGVFWLFCSRHFYHKLLNRRRDTQTSHLKTSVSATTSPPKLAKYWCQNFRIQRKYTLKSFSTNEMCFLFWTGLTKKYLTLKNNLFFSNKNILYLLLIYLPIRQIFLYGAPLFNAAWRICASCQCNNWFRKQNKAKKSWKEEVWERNNSMTDWCYTGSLGSTMSWSRFNISGVSFS